FPGIGVLTDDRYSASRYIAHLTPTPVLLLQGDADKLVPCHHAFSLYDAASPPKRLVVVPGLDHVQTLRQPEIQQTVLDFFAQAAAGTPPTGVEASLKAMATCKR
ncbi:MAG: alpha/beta hydrolase, partial [Azoarcus sp.]|nr:alpha/beta hydrolase [Azoarcus sp.]